MKQTIISAHSPGGLGNILVQLAHIAAFCIEHDKSMYAATFSRVAAYFEQDTGLWGHLYPSPSQLFPSIPFEKHIKGTYRLAFREFWTKPATTCYSFSNSVGAINLQGMEDTLNLETPEFKEFVESHRFNVLMGWRFRSPSLIFKHSDKLRQLFQIKQQYHQPADQILQTARSSNRPLVAVHIRRGDYEGGEYFWTVDTYVSIMKSIQKLLENPIFVICSNENIYDSIPHTLDCVFPKGDMITDLLCMSKCDYIAAPPSTFSGWAAFVNRVPRCQILSPNQEITLDQFVIDSEVDGPCTAPIEVKLNDIAKS